MSYLLLAVLTIIIYTEVLPTISVLFELIRTFFAAKIAIIQQNTVHTQEDIQNTQARMETTHSVAIGFHAPQELDTIEDDEEYYE